MMSRILSWSTVKRGAMKNVLRTVLLSLGVSGATTVVLLEGHGILRSYFFLASLIAPGLFLGFHLLLLLRRNKVLCFAYLVVGIAAMLLISRGFQKLGIPDWALLPLGNILSLYVFLKIALGKKSHSIVLVVIPLIGCVFGFVIQHFPYFEMERAFVVPIVSWQLLATWGVFVANENP